MNKPSLEPVTWRPPKSRNLTPAGLPDIVVHSVPGVGPEDVLTDTEGRVYCGVNDGRILRVDPSGHSRVVANTYGRPLGLEWLPNGHLLVCDAHRGPLSVDVATGGVEVLTDTVDGIALGICNNAAVASDGTIWFTDSSARFDLEHYKGDLLEHSGTGRLLRRDPDGSTATVMTGLQFANGVALSPDEQQLYLAQTGSYSLTRLDLTTPEMPAVVVDHSLPGFPDNLSTGSDGLIWLALASPRNALVDRLATLPGFFRKAAWALPDALQPQPENVIAVMAFDPVDDHLVHYFYGEHPGFGTTTGVRENNGVLWLGSLVSPAVASFQLPR
jgi:sugar lactone lactonase YvrE